ncbi:hypothetical protein ACIBCA_04660 [Kitasatospora sp. NPDC051170]|uniref:hypothetical protein n=1 Tax=Kitasatospora sp. NPDC051170 TaxID=3364056 RepID=UPI0037B2ABB9
MTVLDVRRVGELLRWAAAEPGEVERVAGELMELVAGHEGSWTAQWEVVLAGVREVPQGVRDALADALEARVPGEGADAVARGNALSLVAVVEQTLPGRNAARRRAELEDVARWHTLWDDRRFVDLAETEIAAGGTLSPGVVAVFRRSAMDGYCGDQVLEIVRKSTEPVLDVGEEWAERAMRETEGVPAWEALLRHAVTATASKPTRRWEQQALALVEPLGEDEVRARWCPGSGSSGGGPSRWSPGSGRTTSTPSTTRTTPRRCAGWCGCSGCCPPVRTRHARSVRWSRAR